MEKIPNFINIDIDPRLKPDKVADFTVSLPYADNSVDQIVMYHVIEHIEKHKWEPMFAELFRVLKPKSQLWITFPNFEKCYENWKNNYRGKREFWENTLYGRQSSKYDYHVSICTPEIVAGFASKAGFILRDQGPEPIETYNSFVILQKSKPPITYQEAVLRTIY